MARNNNTDVGFWLSIPLIEFLKWIKTNNRIKEEYKKE
jgi:hypothetical protein